MSQEYIRLARSLPPRLLNFFKRYPPGSQPNAPSTTLISVAENTSAQDPNATTGTQTSPSSGLDYQRPVHSQVLNPQGAYTPANPFLPFVHPISGHWHPAAYSLRRQAELVKLASRYNVESLLPWTPKLPSEIERKRIEHGLRVKGTGLGQKVKGKLWERTLKGRLDQRTKAMEGMDELIQQWKQRGHGRGWKKWPK